VLDIERGEVVVPSFIGKSIRAAVEIAEESGLELNVVGSGSGREQSPAAGEHVATGTHVRVKFAK
jgi:beta-lactam-binding protein with PASTA domain